ncbi:hypothetical protein L484_008590 [Morus notabilis]|uniref:Uncharacterized protein n=1 Tax=Morus notabilis TaxID=981085 RepID=W9QUB0_9ROSA|nr:hypothetical protein L484_008590 [Morus notabilis]
MGHNTTTQLESNTYFAALASRSLGSGIWCLRRSGQQCGFLIHKDPDDDARFSEIWAMTAAWGDKDGEGTPI